MSKIDDIRGIVKVGQLDPEDYILIDAILELASKVQAIEDYLVGWKQITPPTGPIKFGPVLNNGKSYHVVDPNKTINHRADFDKMVKPMSEDSEHLEPNGGNLYKRHKLQINSGEFWRCTHGLTGYDNNMNWVGCKECELLDKAFKPMSELKPYNGCICHRQVSSCRFCMANYIENVNKLIAVLTGKP